MAGHSKWAKIKRDKASNDAKRGAVFTKLGNQLAVAARSGTDPATNAALATVIETAKAANMPMSTIDKAIKRVADKSQAVLEEILYEGYGHAGVAILVECATDNRKRTFPEVKSTFGKYGGSMAQTGSVVFQFERKGEIIVQASGDEAILKILDAGAEDASELDDEIVVTTDPRELHTIRQRLVESGLAVTSAELVYQPKTTVTVEPAVATKLTKLLDALGDLNDVVNVSTNFEPTD